MLPACSSSPRRTPRSVPPGSWRRVRCGGRAAPAVPGRDRQCTGSGMRTRNRRLEAAASAATAVDAARSWQESTIEPTFAATADMIAAFSHGQASRRWPSASRGGAISRRFATQPAIRQISDDDCGGFTHDNAASRAVRSSPRPGPRSVPSQRRRAGSTARPHGRGATAISNNGPEMCTDSLHRRFVCGTVGLPEWPMLANGKAHWSEVP